MMNKVAMLIPYFGKWPEWIEFYWHSCAQNKQIDFYFFTDCPIPERRAENLFFVSQSFGNYCDLVSEHLQIDFHPASPYKLCGLKPFYGYIHEELIQDYSHWGFCDVDLIFGKIDHFTNLTEWDVFSTHADRISGHFCVLRNNNYYTHLCFKIKNWKAKLMSERFYALDEDEFSNLIYPASWCLRKIRSKIVNKLLNWRDAWVFAYRFLCPAWNAVFVPLTALFHKEKRKMHFKEMHTTPILSDDGLSCKYDSERWYYRNGEVINAKANEPCIYVHFMIYKKNVFRKDWYWKGDFYHLSRSDFSNVVIDKSGFWSL